MYMNISLFIVLCKFIVFMQHLLSNIMEEIKMYIIKV